MCRPARSAARAAILLPALAMLLLLAVPVAAQHRVRAPEAVRIPGAGQVPLAMAVGDVDGNGQPEIATYDSDNRLHVFARVQNVWTQVYVSTTASLFAAETPTVRYTAEAAIAPPSGFGPGQFLFGIHTTAGFTIVSVRRANPGTWSEETVFTDMDIIPLDGAFSRPALLRANGSGTPEWRLVVPGKLFFDPPAAVYLPTWSTPNSPPYIVHSSSGGYCDQSLGYLPGAEVGDFDHDGVNEIVIAKADELWLSATQSVGTNPAPFQCWPWLRRALPPGGSPAQIVAAELGGGPGTDLVVRNSNGRLDVSLSSNAAPWNFVTTAHPAGFSAASTGLAIGDIDGDGDQDLVQSFSAAAGYEVRLNNGAGSFGPPAFTPFSEPVKAVQLKDMNGDSKLDLLLAIASTANPQVLILHGNGVGSFGALPAHVFSELAPSSVAADDIDGDGANDLIVGGLDTDGINGNEPLALFQNQLGGALGSPSFSLGAPGAPASPLQILRPFASAVGGDVRLGIAGPDGYDTLIPSGSTTLPPMSFIQTGSAYVTGSDYGDLDQDGFTDHALLTYEPGLDSSRVNIVTLTTSFAITRPGLLEGLRVVNWNVDGLADLLVLNRTQSRLEYWQNDGAGGFLPPFSYLVGVPLDEASPSRVPPFVLVASPGLEVSAIVRSGDNASVRQVEVFGNWENTSLGIIDLTISSGSGTLACFAAGDVNGDNFPDVVLGEHLSEGTYLSALQYAGFPSAIPFIAGDRNLVPNELVTAIAMSDITGDGFADLLAVTDDSSIPTAASAAGGLPPAGELFMFPADSVRIITEGVEPGPWSAGNRLALAIAPNPVRGSAGSLTFALPHAGRVEATLYDLSGRRVRVLFDGERPAGVHSLPLDMRDAEGHALTAGVYFVRVQAGDERATRRVVRIR